MQQHTKIVDVLIASWPDMPNLIGSDWERVEGELLFLIEQYSGQEPRLICRHTKHQIQMLKRPVEHLDNRSRDPNVQ
jgi:hypothetical protein